MIGGCCALFPLSGDSPANWSGGLPWRFSRRQSLHAEVLFLRRQLALYVERGVKPRRIDPVTRISLAILSRVFNWRDALVVVHPETMIRWHRAGWKLFWRLKSRPGDSPRLHAPLDVQGGNSGFSTNRTEVSAPSPARPTEGQLAVVDVPAPACPVHH